MRVEIKTAVCVCADGRLEMLCRRQKAEEEELERILQLSLTEK